MFLIKINQRIKKFIKSEVGASGIEYAIIASMVALALVVFVTPISGKITTLFTTLQNAL